MIKHEWYHTQLFTLANRIPRLNKEEFSLKVTNTASGNESEIIYLDLTALIFCQKAAGYKNGAEQKYCVCYLSFPQKLVTTSNDSHCK